MSTTRIRQWFDAALRRWPSVAWSFERFVQFLSGRVPDHPEEMFLAGAASERVDAAWMTLQMEYRPKVVPGLHKYANRGLTVEDLWQSIMTKMMDVAPGRGPLPDGRPVARIGEFRGEAQLALWLKVVGARLGLDYHRRRKVERTFLESEAQSSDDRTQVAPPMADESRAAVEHLRQALISLSTRHRAMLGMVFGQGMQIGRAGRLVGCRDASAATRLLKDALARLRMAMEGFHHHGITEEDIHRMLGVGWSPVPEDSDHLGGGVPA